MVIKASVDAVLDKIDSFVGAEMDHFGTPGVAVSVVYDDVVLFSKGYGVREVGNTLEHIGYTRDEILARLATSGLPPAATPQPRSRARRSRT
jgi:hypothetical protein